MTAKLFFGLILFGLAICCANQPTLKAKSSFVAENKNMAMENTMAEVTLKGDARIENNKLIVDYTFRNNTDRPVYVFDEMIAYDGEQKPVIDRKTAYCFFEEPKTLRLARATLRLPLEKDVYSLEIPYAREVKPKTEVKGTIELEIPVKEKSPFYAPPMPENSKIMRAEKVRLLVGWTHQREGMTIMEVNIGGEKVLRIRGSYPAPFQKLVEGNFTLPVDVMVYTTTFDRQMPLN